MKYRNGMNSVKTIYMAEVNVMANWLFYLFCRGDQTRPGAPPLAALFLASHRRGSQEGGPGGDPYLV